MKQAFLMGNVVPWLRPKMALAVSILMALAGAIQAQTLTDLGATAPTPGANDIAQLSTAGNQTAPDGLNYYTDNQTGHGTGEPGQTFTTGTNSCGIHTVVSVYKDCRAGFLQRHRHGSALLSPHLFRVRRHGHTAANLHLGQCHLQRRRLAAMERACRCTLAANTTYAWSFGKASSTSGWEALAVASGNPYAGGQIGLFPPAGGAITFGSSHDFDAVFDVGLVPAKVPSINQLTVSPTNNVFAGTVVTFTASVSGAQPLYFQWQFNNGGGYANIPGADTNTLALTAAITNTGSYQLVLTNSYGAVTSAPVTLTVTAATINPISVSPTNNVFGGTVVTFTASVSGASPLHFQWQFSSGGRYANISGANTNTLALTAAITNTGSYELVVTNSYGAVTSAPVALTVTATTINQITVSPTNNVFVGTVVTFTASVSGTPPLYFQWQCNTSSGYTNIPRANTNTLALTAAIPNTGSYELVVTNSYGAVTSAPTALLVTLDTNPPVVLRAFNLGPTNVEVDFSKLLQAASANTVVNYALTNGTAISGASLSANSTTIILTTAPLVYGSNYTLVINSLLDQAIPPNMIAANTRVSFTASPRNRLLLDAGWRFQLGDPVDVTTNVTVYPEIPDLTKLEDSGTGAEFTGANSETNLMTLRPDPVATHAGENVSFVMTNYNDSAWRLLNLPHDWVVELPFDSSADAGHGFNAGIMDRPAQTPLPGIVTRSLCRRWTPGSRCGWSSRGFIATP